MKLRDFEVVSKYLETQDEENNTVTISDGGKKLNFIMPYRATNGSAGYDIFNNTGSDIILNPGETAKVSTYLKSYMLPDEVLLLLTRSGHGFKYLVRLANTVGVIDSDYYNNPDNEGEIFIKVTNPERSGKTLEIKNGEAMCQGIYTKILFTDSDNQNINSNNKRQSGIGSTTNKELPAIL